ncbi:MAG: hypothetical protein ACXWCM_06840 [Acidimicrobiales bacterium]
MAKVSGTRERRHPAEVPKLPRTGEGALTPDDIVRVLTDESPTWAQLRRKLDKFRYCETCDSWRSGVSPTFGPADQLDCWICGTGMDPL